MSEQIIDTHALIVSADPARYPAAPLGGRRSAWSDERSVTAEQMIRAMDEAGIAKAVLLQSSTTYGFDNSYLADAVAMHPDRFGGVFSVNVLDEDAPRQMRHWFGRGLRGMRIFAQGSTMSEAWLAIDDARTRPSWDCAAELGIPVATNASDLTQVVNVLGRHPRLDVILEHVTRPQIAEGPPYAGLGDLLALAGHPNLCLRITPRTFHAARLGSATPESYLRTLVGAFGAERILWGSYFPPTPATLSGIVADALGVLAGLPEADRRAILSGTARRLFPALR
jgi:predicted TIM-barrel fold metal-dependent hydrolase